VLSQKALDGAAGFDRTYISLLELERCSVSIDTLESIAGVLGAEPHTLIMPVPSN
jgi:transcriptional regulator with XRE-family HTH domain